MIAEVSAGLAGLGGVQALLASRLVVAFAGQARLPGVVWPPVTVLKPLHGDEPLLEDALATLCRQAYPAWQIVFGVQDAEDPAIAVVDRLRTRFPDCDMTLVCNAAVHGVNLKVGNLINMLPAAKHDVLVIADSDVHVRADYLERLVTALAQPDVGLVTVLYAGVPASRGWVAALGATQVTHGFLPGALLGRWAGRRDCLGATMALRRGDLGRIGGLHALVDHLADDNVLGRLVTETGQLVALAGTVVLTTVPETGWADLLLHELRWARTIRALAPVGFAASVLQYPLAWGLLAVLLSGGALWSVGLFGIVWVVRALAGVAIDRALAPAWGSDANAALAFRCPVWLLPLRDVLSVIVLIASYGGRRVIWRGHALRADAHDHALRADAHGHVLRADTPARSDYRFRPFEGLHLR